MVGTKRQHGNISTFRATKTIIFKGSSKNKTYLALMHLAIEAYTTTTRIYQHHHFIYDLKPKNSSSSFWTKMDDSGAKEKTTKTTSSKANEKEWHGHALVPAAPPTLLLYYQ